MKIAAFALLFIISAYSCQLSAEMLERPIITQEKVNQINSKNSSWKSGYNAKFATATYKDYIRLLGTRRMAKEEFELLPKIFHDESNASIPDTYNAQEAYPNCKSLFDIRDQAECGSCWAFGAAEVMSDRICIKSNGKLQTSVSTEQLVACCSSCGDGCDGGYPFAAFQYWNKGIVSGGAFNDKNTCLPYFCPNCDHHVSGQYPKCQGERPTPKCVKKCQAGYPVSFNDDKSYGTAYSISSNVKQIQLEILNNGPVEAAFDVYDDGFETYSGGVYVPDDTQQILGGHAVKIIGWGTEDGKDYWLIANSWNSDWGVKGLYKMIRGINAAGIEDQIVAGLPKLSSDNLQFLQ